MNFRFYSPELRSKEWPEWHNADELVIGSRVALGSYNWIRWVGASIVPFLNNPLWLCFCFDDGCLNCFQLCTFHRHAPVSSCLKVSFRIDTCNPQPHQVGEKSWEIIFFTVSYTDVHCLSSLPLAPHLPLWPGGDWMDCSTHGYSSVCKRGQDMAGFCL